MPQDQLRIGLIGAGRIGRLHGDNIAFSVPQATVTAVADIVVSDQTRDWAKARGAQLVTDQPEELINSPLVDAVLICSSTPTHADYIVKAAQAGRHIFCEKPLDTDPLVIVKALAAVDKAKVKLQTGFVRRFDHNHQKVHDAVASGVIGRPHLVKITSRDPQMQPVEYLASSGGIFLDMTIHDFDMARYLAGAEATEVTAFGALLIAPDLARYGDVDTAVVVLKFENGALGIIDNSRAAHYGYDQRSEVHGEKGCVQTGNDLIDQVTIQTADGVSRAKPTWFFLERYTNAFIDEIKSFADSALGGTETKVGGRDGLMAVCLAAAAAKSLKEGRTVKVSEVAAAA
jgi:myo-inositol 2-dehydrogenase/D-chiro-inositol 1-dehydrogenase